LKFKSWLLAVAFFISSPASSVFQETPLLVQNPEARTHISLDGSWSVIVDPYENGFYNHRYEEHDNGYFKNSKARAPSDLVEYDFSKSQKLVVPGDWNTQDNRLFLYEGTIWYQKDFNLKKKVGKRYVIHFGAVNYSAIVYINGEKVGRHEGGFTPFQFDISTYLKDGNNFVVVKVDNSRQRDQVPTVNTDWWNYGGITRPVKILELDSIYIADYFIEYGSTRDHSISGWVELAGDVPGETASIHLKLPGLGIDQELNPNGNGRAEFEIKASPDLWTPENPVLYDFSLSYRGSVVKDRVGFRTIGVDGDDILLNGEPVFLRGISLHEESPKGEGRAWSEEDARTLLGWARDLGCNFVRLAHYPHNETIVRMADEMGLMVWSEIPVYWTILFEREDVYQKAEKQLSEMITRDKNRAAVTLWSVANETPNHPARYEFLSRLVKRARALDSTRLITAALDTQSTNESGKLIDDPFAEIVDVIGVNSYCGWYYDTPESCAGVRWQSSYDKPVIISEFGAGALQGNHGDEQQRFTEENQALVYKNNLLMLDNISALRGVSPWILKDFRSPRRPLPGIQDFWNRKGLLSENGVRKKAWFLMKDWYEMKEKQYAGKKQ
jgi:beta-glucuronidase